MVERASATVWELIFKRTGATILFIYTALSIVVLLNGEHLRSLPFAAVLTGSFMLFMDYLAYSRFELRTIHYGQGLIVIHTTSVHPNDIISLQLLHYDFGRTSISLVEVVFRSANGETRALAPSKPTWSWRSDSPTINILVEQFPQLKDRVLTDYSTSRRKEVRDPSLRKTDPPYPDRPPVDPAARYRDPYFRRRRA